MTGELSIDLTRFNTGCAVYANTLKLAPKDVVSQQAGLLMLDLARNLPPKDPEKTKATIQKAVQDRFSILTAPGTDFSVGSGGKEGRGDIHWIGSSPSLLFGIAKDVDMTKATPEDLRKLYYHTTKSGKISLGHRGKQRVKVSQKITTREATRAKLVKIIQDRVGLLRASFCKGLSAVQAKGKPPAWVAKQIDKAKGDFINGLNQPGKAEFSIISNAAGVTSEKSTFFLQGALDRRANAMVTRAQYLSREAKKKAGFN